MWGVYSSLLLTDWLGFIIKQYKDDNMKIICSDINILKSSFEAISKIVLEVSMEIDSDGLRVNAIDPSHVTFVHLDINEYEFDVFECETPRKICFVTDEFLKYLKRTSKDSVLELSVDGNYLMMRSEGATNKTFKLKLLEDEILVPDLPGIDYPISIDMPTKIFKEVCSDISEFSPKVQISNKGNLIDFVAYGDFTDAEIEYVYQNDYKEQYSSVYDMEKIKDMLKADKFAKTTYLSWGNDMPLLVEMKSENGNQCLEFLLAPRIEEE